MFRNAMSNLSLTGFSRVRDPRPSFKPALEGLEDRLVPVFIDITPIFNNLNFGSPSGSSSDLTVRDVFRGQQILRGRLRTQLKQLLEAAQRLEAKHLSTSALLKDPDFAAARDAFNGFKDTLELERNLGNGLIRNARKNPNLVPAAKEFLRRHDIFRRAGTLVKLGDQLVESLINEQVQHGITSFLDRFIK